MAILTSGESGSPAFVQRSLFGGPGFESRQDLVFVFKLGLEAEGTGLGQLAARLCRQLMPGKNCNFSLISNPTCELDPWASA